MKQEEVRREESEGDENSVVSVTSGVWMGSSDGTGEGYEDVGRVWGGTRLDSFCSSVG